MDSVIFYSLLQQLTKSQPKPYYSTSATIQSSVGLIFRYSTKQPSLSIHQLIQSSQDVQQLEILMVQRAGFEKDPNACKYSQMQSIQFSLVDKPIQENLILRLARGNSGRRLELKSTSQAICMQASFHAIFITPKKEESLSISVAMCGPSINPCSSFLN